MVNVLDNNSPFTETHETMHVLLNASDDPNNPDYPTEFDDLTMVWDSGTAGTSTSNTVTATKRISAQQAKDALTKTTFPQ